MLETHLLKIPENSEHGVAFASSSRHLLSVSEYLGIGQYGQFQLIMIENDGSTWSFCCRGTKI